MSLSPNSQSDVPSCSLRPLRGKANRQARSMVGPTLLIGSDAACDVQMRSTQVARRHCLLLREGGQIRARQLDPGYPLLCNGRPITDEPLRDGDILTLGPFQLAVSVENLPAADDHHTGLPRTESQPEPRPLTIEPAPPIAPAPMIAEPMVAEILPRSAPAVDVIAMTPPLVEALHPTPAPVEAEPLQPAPPSLPTPVSAEPSKPPTPAVVPAPIRDDIVLSPTPVEIREMTPSATTRAPAAPEPPTPAVPAVFETSAPIAATAPVNAIAPSPSQTPRCNPIAMLMLPPLAEEETGAAGADIVGESSAPTLDDEFPPAPPTGMHSPEADAFRRTLAREAAKPPPASRKQSEKLRALRRRWLARRRRQRDELRRRQALIRQRGVELEQEARRVNSDFERQRIELARQAEALESARAEDRVLRAELDRQRQSLAEQAASPPPPATPSNVAATGAPAAAELAPIAAAAAAPKTPAPTIVPVTPKSGETTEVIEQLKQQMSAREKAWRRMIRQRRDKLEEWSHQLTEERRRLDRRRALYRRRLRKLRDRLQRRPGTPAPAIIPITAHPMTPPPAPAPLVVNDGIVARGDGAGWLDRLAGVEIPSEAPVERSAAPELRVTPPTLAPAIPTPTMLPTIKAIVRPPATTVIHTPNLPESVLLDRLARAALLDQPDLERIILQSRRLDQPLAVTLRESGLLTRFQLEAVFTGHLDRLMMGEALILDELHVGPIARTYRVQVPGFREAVALKRLRGAWTQGVELRQAFAAAYRPLRALRRPNVATFLDLFPMTDGIGALWEFVPGVAIDRLPADQRTPRRMMDLFRQGARGLAGAQQTGFAHRRLTPRKLMVSDAGVLKILGYGMPDWLMNVRRCESAAGADDQHAAPELKSGRPTDARGDLYSLASIMVTQILQLPTPPAPSALWLPTEYPSTFTRLLAKALHPDPAVRGRSIQEYADTTGAILDDLPTA